MTGSLCLPIHDNTLMNTQKGLEMLFLIKICIVYQNQFRLAPVSVFNFVEANSSIKRSHSRFTSSANGLCQSQLLSQDTTRNRSPEVFTSRKFAMISYSMLNE